MALTDNDTKTVLFLRDFKGFTGGHLKVWHYYNHVCSDIKFHPYILFTNESLWNDSNPWLSAKNFSNNTKSDRFLPDIAFLAGLDWLRWQHKDKNIPTINLIQHVRHANPEQTLYRFLTNKAIRICVSEQVRDSLARTKKTNGPMFTIPNGLDWSYLPEPTPFLQRNTDILIAGLKNKTLALSLQDALKPLKTRIKVLTRPMLQSNYFACVKQAKITVLLPNSTEGFYLPALESMALRNLVICPDCVGNRSFCLSGFNCLQPEYTSDGILHAIYQALSLSQIERQKMLFNARLTAHQYNLEKERKLFLNILNNIDQIW